MQSQIAQSQPLYVQIYEIIRESILIGTILADEQINEAQLAKNLNVSRGPIREAVRKLEQEGLLVRKNNSLYVYKSSKEDLQQIYECRTVLESLAVRLATNNPSADIILLEISEVIEEKEKLLKETHTKEMSNKFTELCSLFHDIILEGSGNERLIQQINQLRSLTYFYRNSKLRIAERRNQVFQEHFKIFQAMKENDAKRASILMEEHMETDLKFLLKHF